MHRSPRIDLGQWMPNSPCPVMSAVLARNRTRAQGVARYSYSKPARMNTQGVTVQDDVAAQAMLHRMVVVLLWIAMESDGAVDPEAGFPAAFEYEIRVVRKLQGHFQYYNDNWEMLMKFREAARTLGLRWMRRRSQKGRNLSWEAYGLYLERHPLPNPGQTTDLIAMGSVK